MVETAMRAAYGTEGEMLVAEGQCCLQSALLRHDTLPCAKMRTVPRAALPLESQSSSYPPPNTVYSCFETPSAEKQSFQPYGNRRISALPDFIRQVAAPPKEYGSVLLLIRFGGVRWCW